MDFSYLDCYHGLRFPLYFRIIFLSHCGYGFSLGGRPSAANPCGLCPVPRGSAGLPQKIISSKLRRTSGRLWRTPPKSVRIRADSAANWRSCMPKKCPSVRTFRTPLSAAEGRSRRTSFRRRRFRGRGFCGRSFRALGFR